MGYSILMIDDNLADIRLVVEAFKDIDFYDQLECLYAYDGEEAIGLLDAAAKTGQKLDLILLDLNLPRIHGIEVLAYVKGHPLLNKVPVFVISNSDYHKDISNCSDLSADGYIQKPNDFKDLVDLASAIKKSLLSNTAIVPEILLAEYASIKAAC